MYNDGSIVNVDIVVVKTTAVQLDLLILFWRFSVLSFDFGKKVLVRSSMAVLVKRNDRTQVFYQKEWNPYKNPGFQTLKVKNQVEILRDLRYRDTVEVVVSDKFGPLEPREIRNGSLFFRSYGRITVDIIDHRAGEKQSLLAWYEEDRGHTLCAKLVAETVVQLDPKKQPLTAHPDLPENLVKSGNEGGNGHGKQPEIASSSDIAGQQCDHDTEKRNGKHNQHANGDKPESGERPNGKPRLEPEKMVRIPLGAPASETAEELSAG